MDKVLWKPGNIIYPLPVVMVSCGDNEKEWNIITIAWTGTICTEPPMCYISIRKNRHSYNIISKNKEYVLNLTTSDMAYQTDWCGVKSGKDFNKFKEMKLTPIKANMVKAPLIKESPVNIECKVKDIIQLGSHDMFISEVLCINASSNFINPDTGEFDMRKAKLMCYSHGKYYELGKLLGKYGFSVRKK